MGLSCSDFGRYLMKVCSSLDFLLDSMNTIFNVSVTEFNRLSDASKTIGIESP